MFKDSTLYINCKHKPWGFYGHSDMCVLRTHSQQIEVTLCLLMLALIQPAGALVMLFIAVLFMVFWKPV